MYLYCKYSPELVFIQLYISIVIILYYLHFQPHHSRFFHKSIEKKNIINSMWCQFHELIYQEFPVGIPRRFFLCEELLYTWHSTILLNFFFEKRICTTPRQGKKESFVPQMSSKKEKKFLEKRKKFIQFFFLHSKRNVLVIICHQDHVQLQSLKKRSCTSNTTVSFLMQEVL